MKTLSILADIVFYSLLIGMYKTLESQLHIKEMPFGIVFILCAAVALRIFVKHESK